jgi:glyoxylase-like metal-dependent hydrolase (beta-lactamase superfamily II)
MKVHRIIVPTPFYVGPTNVYLVQEDPLTLIDAGPRTKEAMQALKDGLRQLGHRLMDIKRIIITHAHADHYGLARDVAEESGASVFIHAWDAPAVLTSSDHTAYQHLLGKAGVPEAMIEKMINGQAKFLGWTNQLDSVETLEDEQEIEFEHESLMVVHTPGHTPGSISLARLSSRTIFTSDTVLKNITPNPVLSPDPYDESKRFQSLGEYLVSLARLRSLSPTLLHGGHGDDVTDYEEHFHRLYRHTQTRQSKLLGLITRDGTTAWDASQKLFPTATSYHRFLALSETQAHLDFALSENKLVLEKSGSQEFYHLP